MLNPMTKDQVAAAWKNYTAALRAVSTHSRTSSELMGRLQSNSPQAGSTPDQLAEWRAVAVSLAAHAAASQVLTACAADLARMILNESEVAKAFEQACNGTCRTRRSHDA